MVSPPDNPRQEPNPPITPEIEMQRLQQALELHQTGQLAQAQLIYEDILKTNPRHGDCLHLLGVVASQTESRIVTTNPQEILLNKEEKRNL